MPILVCVSDPLFSRHAWKWGQQPVRYLVGTTSLAGRRKISAETQGPCGRHTVCSYRTYLRGMDDSSNNDNWRRAMASCKRESRLTSLGHAPAMGPHLACEWPGRQRANLRVEVSAQPYLVDYAQTLARRANGRSARSVELKCLCVVERPRLVSVSIHPSTSIH